jgi:hypothetical protein
MGIDPLGGGKPAASAARRLEARCHGLLAMLGAALLASLSYSRSLY